MQNKIQNLLKEYTKHDHIKLTSRGNMSIFLAMYMAKKENSKPYFLIPDQGGWLTYKTYPKIFNFNIKELKTDKGIIDLEELKQVARKCSALLYSNPAGYFAEQPAKEIYEICKEEECLVIMDVSGSIGNEICNGEYADFMVGSFGRWKPVNVEYGGFISAKEQWPDKNIFSLYRSCDEKLQQIYEKLKEAPEKINSFMQKAEKIKQDLNELEIIHKDKKGINVVVAYKTDFEKTKIIEYCEKNNLEYTECPRYIRVEEPAISIEIKR